MSLWASYLLVSETYYDTRLPGTNESGNIPSMSGNQWTRKDSWQAAALVLLTILLSIRKGPFWEAFLISLRHILLYYLYGVAMVFIFVGLTKKTVKYKPNKATMVKWAIGLGAFFAVSQFVHEGFLMFTGQLK